MFAMLKLEVHMDAYVDLGVVMPAAAWDLTVLANPRP
jgi:hypothetical protein